VISYATMRVLMNIYEMYVANGNRAGFSVHRNSWASHNTAQVLSVAGQESGPLSGAPPYYGNPLVIADHPWGVGRLSCPGTYAYELVGGGS
jgi:hypothetical protein